LIRITVAESLGYSFLSWNETVTDAMPQPHSFETVTDTYENQGEGVAVYAPLSSKATRIQKKSSDYLAPRVLLRIPDPARSL
jgi:hypothetical protein